MPISLTQIPYPHTLDSLLHSPKATLVAAVALGHNQECPMHDLESLNLAIWHKKKSTRYSGHLTARKTCLVSCSHQTSPNSYHVRGSESLTS